MAKVTTTRTALEKALRKALKNDVCIAQSLDESADRTRVFREVMRTVEAVALNHALLYEALNAPEYLNGNREVDEEDIDHE